MHHAPCITRHASIITHHASNTLQHVVRAAVYGSMTPMKGLLAACGGCLAASCDACWFRRHRSALEAECNLVPGVTWLQVTGEGVGCAACSAFGGAGGHWRCFQTLSITTRDALKQRSLQRHAKTARHLAAAKAMLAKANLRGIGAPEEDAAAPPLAVFAKVVAHLRKHPLGREGVPGIAGRDKARLLSWCVAEAHREVKRRLWSEADGPVVSTIFQDARHGQLTVRFTAASLQPLRRCAGHLGTVNLAADFSFDSLGIQAGTLAAINKLCTKRPAPRNQAAELVADDVVLQRVRQSVEAFVSDAAADEIRAGFMMAGQTVRCEVSNVLPSLRIVLRDKPHASRRLLSRLWKADPFLHAVHSMFVWDEKSPTKLIQNSQQFSAWFQKNISALELHLKAVATPHRRVKDMRFAGHRFDSSQMALARCVLYFPAVITTMAQVVQTRPGTSTEAKAVNEFFQQLDPEKALQMAMLADAGEEHCTLMRLLDYEGFPADDLSYNLSAFVDRVGALFGVGGCQADALHAGCGLSKLSIACDPRIPKQSFGDAD